MRFALTERATQPSIITNTHYLPRYNNLKCYFLSNFETYFVVDVAWTDFYGTEVIEYLHSFFKMSNSSCPPPLIYFLSQASVLLLQFYIKHYSHKSNNILRLFWQPFCNKNQLQAWKIDRSNQYHLSWN